MTSFKPIMESGVESSWEPRFAWLDITQKCQIACLHCYRDASPKGDHGTMTTSDWKRVITELSDLGVEMVQFIGGEPTLHPDLPVLIDFALFTDLRVEVFSNLVSVSDKLWEKFQLPGVSLATSYYTADRLEHKKITGGYDTWRQTTANIARARELGIDVRVGVVQVLPNQRIAGAIINLQTLGVPQVGKPDILREVGRGSANSDRPLDTSQLCGGCTSNVLAIKPDGTVSPCVFSAQLVGGNVLRESLGSILTGEPLQTIFDELNQEFDARRGPACAPQKGGECMPKTGPCAPRLIPSPRRPSPGSLAEVGEDAGPQDFILDMICVPEQLPMMPCYPNGGTITCGPSRKDSQIPNCGPHVRNPQKPRPTGRPR
jgi:MoaA/NifB/PqqE/SkfB family radical SAM enzyme